MKTSLSLSRIPGASSFCSLKNSVRRYYDANRFNWPIYDLFRYSFNREPKQLYRSEGRIMQSISLEQKVARELKQNGLSVVHFSDLLPAHQFSELQELAEALMQKPAIQERIKAIEAGARPGAKSGKFYLVRPMGDRPALDVNDKFLKVCLSDPILRVVCSYFGMFARLVDIELWYNVATDGSDVFSQRWHRDNEDRQIVKIFLYLHDVDHTNGPFCYIPRTHNAGLYKRIFPQTIDRSVYPPDGAVEKKFATIQKRVCVGKAGTLIFADTTGFHRGGHPTAGGRLLFHAYYATNACLPVVTSEKRYSIVRSDHRVVGSAARYAISHVEG
jgi:ectoine hydroxylase-related dioxygenase (phytanoyl-CoA dioxygenase family)